jgi:hypothetical protein
MIPVQIQFLENTPKRLAFRQRPVWKWFQGLWGVVAIVIMLLNSKGASFYGFFIFLVICLFVLHTLAVKGQILTCTFDKTIGQVTLVRQGILGTHVARHLLRDISLVELEIYVYKFEYIDKTYKISLLLMSGNSIPLKLAALYDEKKVRDTALVICSFLNLRPYTETKVNRWYW